MAADSSRRYLRLLYLSSNLAALGLLIPFVALALVLASSLGHVRGTPRVFFGFLTLVAFGGALSRAIMLGQTLRIGRLKVSGKIVQRQEAPRRFWTWVAITALPPVFYISLVMVFAWATLNVAA